MRFPAKVTVLRPAGVDEYGNADSSFSAPASAEWRAFILSDDTLMVEPKADLQVGDRMVVNGKVYTFESAAVRSARGVVMHRVSLQVLEVQP